MHTALLCAAVAASFQQSAPPKAGSKVPHATAAKSSRGPDSDGDGLADFDELHKYLTDPARADSDGDGIPDGDWDERREYAYTIRSVVDVCPPVTDELLLVSDEPPVSEAFLCDDFQDARVLERAPDHLRVEVVHYPFSTAQAEITPDPEWRAHVVARNDLKRFLEPGPTTNFDDSMRAELVTALAGDGIDALRLDDKSLVERTSRWLLDHTRFEDGFTTYTATFRDGKASVLPELKERVDADLKALGRTLEEQWSRELFAKGMFEQRVHGSCTSSAILWNGVFRALGIPTRIVLVVPVVDASDPEEVAWLATKLENHRVSALLRDALPPSDAWSNHTFNEVFVGGRWRRLNYAKLGQGILDANYLGLMTHVATVADWADGEFARTYGVREMLHRGAKDAFGGANPYSCVELSDRFGVHSKLENPAVPVHEKLTIERAYWWSSPERNVEMKLDDPATAGHLLFHVAELFPDQGPRQYQPFYDAVDHDFLLRADGHEEVPATATRGFWCNPKTEEREFYLRVEPADVARIERNVAYHLVAKNAKPGRRWIVAPDVRITRTSDPQPFAAPRTTELVLTIDSLNWSDDRSLPDPLRRDLARSGATCLLGHVKSWTDFEEIRELTRNSPGFVLDGAGHDPLVIRSGTGGFTYDDGTAKSAWIAFGSDPRWNALVPGVSYRLRPLNEEPGYRWIVADGVAVKARN